MENRTESRTAGEAGEKTGTCVIIGAGELTVDRIPVRDGDLVIAADGGYAYSRRLGLEPDLILGDFDSLDEENRRQVEAIRKECPERVQVLPVMKDDTDMLAAMKEGLKRGFRHFDIYAAAQGKRLSARINGIRAVIDGEFQLPEAARRRQQFCLFHVCSS